ncbi:hypothetical protein [Duganella sp. LjRoot269]
MKTADESGQLPLQAAGRRRSVVSSGQKGTVEKKTLQHNSKARRLCFYRM